MSAEYIKSIMQPYSYKIPPPDEMKVIVEILEAYKRLPCIWDQHHHLYHSKEQRDRAYQVLVNIFKKVNPDANRESTKKKIDNMRNAYRREYKKVLAARERGETEHIPVLWYYHHLTFLDGNRDETLEADADSNGATSEVTDTSIKIEDESEDEVAEIIKQSTSNSNTVGETVEVNVPPPEKKMRFTFEEHVDDEVTQSRQDDPEDSNNINLSNLKKSDVHDIASETFGRTIGLQLQELEPMQRFIAEKLISDVIFFGRLRTLNAQSSLVINNNCNNMIKYHGNKSSS